MASLHVVTLTVKIELPINYHLGSLPFLCTENEAMAPLHVAILRELPKYEIMLASRVSTLPLYQE